YFYFFFSSRRRHTRFSRDWSSDVCSSDLAIRHTPRVPNIIATIASPSVGGKEKHTSIRRQRGLGIPKPGVNGFSHVGCLLPFPVDFIGDIKITASKGIWSVTGSINQNIAIGGNRTCPFVIPGV